MLHKQNVNNGKFYKIINGSSGLLYRITPVSDARYKDPARRDPEGERKHTSHLNCQLLSVM